MNMTAFFILLLIALPVFAQQESTSDIVQRLKTQLDLSDDQVSQISPVVEKYGLAMRDFQKGVADGHMNPSAIESQRQGLQEQETQELSQYLKPYQLSEWRQMQEEAFTEQENEDSADNDQYTNLPNNAPPQ